MENELASLSQTEKYLKNDLKTLEEKIIEHLEKDIKAKKLVLNGLKSRKSDLEKKLSDMRGNPSDSQMGKLANRKPEKSAQQSISEENESELAVFECQKEQTEAVQNSEADGKRNLVFRVSL